MHNHMNHHASGQGFRPQASGTAEVADCCLRLCFEIFEIYCRRQTDHLGVAWQVKHGVRKFATVHSHSSSITIATRFTTGSYRGHMTHWALQAIMAIYIALHSPTCCISHSSEHDTTLESYSEILRCEAGWPRRDSRRMTAFAYGKIA